MKPLHDAADCLLMVFFFFLAVAIGLMAVLTMIGGIAFLFAVEVFKLLTGHKQ